MSGLLVYLVYQFIYPCIFSLDSGIVSGLLVYWFICFIDFFPPCILSLDSGQCIPGPGFWFIWLLIHSRAGHVY